ncbi:hypothetical protein [Metabacillus arenae]|uniref:Uncharacterized protein n=1 Tax=Metabacillus arenae TaxID=2771434 RepID=A0A926RZI7_9BACI|nr:hypothetical protein [Metabacillus arenae]MBD1379099.1 hypothetical protein [Metabacillus arenae]
MIWIVFATAVFNILFALINKTKNFTSSMLYKVIPFFLGLGCLYYSLKILGLI